VLAEMEPTRLESFNIPTGKVGTELTLYKMRDLVKQANQHREIKETAVSLIANCKPQDQLCQIGHIFAFVQTRLRYVRDESGVEELTAPWIILNNLRAGRATHSSDCDDHTMLVSALLKAVGFRTRFVAVASTQAGYDHVRAEVNIDGRWLPLEATRKNESLGFAVKSVLPPMALEVDF